MRGRRAGERGDGPAVARRLSAVSTPGSAQSAVHRGQVLRAHREATGLTQERAAVAAGLTRNTLVAIEKARFPDPHLSTLLALMKVYGVGSLDELLGSMPSRTLADEWEAAGWEGGRPRATGH